MRSTICNNNSIVIEIGDNQYQIPHGKAGERYNLYWGVGAYPELLIDAIKKDKNSKEWLLNFKIK